MNYAIHRDESDKYKGYHRATTRFAREGWLSALAWAKGSGALVRDVLAEALAEGYDSIEGYVAALKQSSATYFAERNSARDAWRRAALTTPDSAANSLAAPDLHQKAKALHDVLGRLHYGRMPTEVADAFQALGNALATPTVGAGAPCGCQPGTCESKKNVVCRMAQELHEGGHQ